MRAVISQPTYLSWMGYFGMIDIADIFVFYDDVQYEKSSWQSRNKIKHASGDVVWLSVPSMRDSLEAKINEIKIKNYPDWRKKHWLTIYHSYQKTPYFKDYMTIFEGIYEKEWNSLCDLNMTIIKELSQMLGIKMPEFIRSSQLEFLEGKKTDRVLSVLEKIGADEYVSTEGTKVYLETNKFAEKGIKLYWHEFKHPIYPQTGNDFVPNLSVIDLLFNTGGDAIKFIREGEKSALVPVALE